ncbi:MAG: GDP-mannose 4,6-dehydratase [Candidatus Margulisiibacteriota bacterium]
MRYLITGGCGFLGSNLAHQVLLQQEDLVVFDNLHRVGSDHNLTWLKTQGPFTFIQGDIRHPAQVEQAVLAAQPDVVFHLAGQVTMTQSIANPREDFEINALGTLNVLEAIRQHAPQALVLYSSTNKVYGDLETLSYQETDRRYIATGFENGFDEMLPLDFRSPYGCSKGCADQYMLDYARVFNLKTAVFRHSSMYGGRQFATTDQGWIGWFCQQALDIKKNPATPFTISGNGKQVRDVLHADDMVRLYFNAVQHHDRLKGEVFNIGGGMNNSLSLLELFQHLETQLNISLTPTTLPPRQSDQKVFVADIRKAERLLGWSPQVDIKQGLNAMLTWVSSLG